VNIVPVIKMLCVYVILTSVSNFYVFLKFDNIRVMVTFASSSLLIACQKRQPNFTVSHGSLVTCWQ